MLITFTLLGAIIVVIYNYMYSKLSNAKQWRYADETNIVYCSDELAQAYETSLNKK